MFGNSAYVTFNVSAVEDLSRHQNLLYTRITLVSGCALPYSIKFRFASANATVAAISVRFIRNFIIYFLPVFSYAFYLLSLRCAIFLIDNTTEWAPSILKCNTKRCM